MHNKKPIFMIYYFVLQRIFHSKIFERIFVYLHPIVGQAIMKVSKLIIVKDIFRLAQMSK